MCERFEGDHSPMEQKQQTLCTTTTTTTQRTRCQRVDPDPMERTIILVAGTTRAGATSRLVQRELEAAHREVRVEIEESSRPMLAIIFCLPSFLFCIKENAPAVSIVSSSKSRCITTYNLFDVQCDRCPPTSG